MANTPREFGAWLDFTPVYKDFSTVDYIEYLWIEDGNDANASGLNEGGGAALIIGGAGNNFAGADDFWIWHHHLSG